MATHDGDDQEISLLDEWEQADDIQALTTRVHKMAAFFTEQVQDLTALLERYGKDFDVEHESWDALAVGHAKLNWMELHRRLLWLRDEQIASMDELQNHTNLLSTTHPQYSTMESTNPSPAFPPLDATAQLLEKLEHRMLYGFYQGDMRVLKRELFPHSEDVAIWSGFYFGMHFGMMVVLFIWAVWDSVIDDSKNHNLWESSVMAIYRATGVLILLLWCWCLQVYTFNWFSIPFLPMFDWKITKSTQFVSLVRQAVSITIVYLVNLLLYFKALRGDIPIHILPPYVIPFLLFLALLLKLVFPLKQRRSLLLTVLRVVAAPWAIVRFREAYVGDILTSLVRVFVDLAWSSCYFVSGAFVEADPTGHDVCSTSTTFHWVVVPLLSALPLWWRFCQNIRKYRETESRFPYIPNAMKYACAQSVVLFAVFHPSLKRPEDHMTTYQWFYLGACVVTTLYQFLWDIYMDWGLGGWTDGLRPLRIYPTWVYYAAMVVDLFLRFGWTLTLIPAQGYGPFPSHIQFFIDPILASAEVFRRSMWGLLRVEYEHTIQLASSRKSIDVTTAVDDESDDDSDDEDQTYSFWVLVEISAVVSLVVVVAAIAVLTRPT
ncbi:Aste57867_21707 [Aphanomyces stellatus]|uniref:Aste57867_21707 protein n=1 Tax=Aphanomyces stellatus TaxID=120398 RepID=A0A485LI87_9STRA|nr:hypothetical protein As57867_021638 [Aphanomyces stellatus]VFT98376.1 Aste57867_21707 [Aphanomyces stellatus]